MYKIDANAKASNPSIITLTNIPRVARWDTSSTELNNASNVRARHKRELTVVRVSAWIDPRTKNKRSATPRYTAPRRFPIIIPKVSALMPQRLNIKFPAKIQIVPISRETIAAAVATV